MGFVQANDTGLGLFLRLWEQGGRGRLHVQSQRFLSEEWSGLTGSGDLSDPPLRGFVQRLARGQSVLQIYDSAPDSLAVASFLSWLAAMRHVPGEALAIFSKRCAVSLAASYVRLHPRFAWSPALWKDSTARSPKSSGEVPLAKCLMCPTSCG